MADFRVMCNSCLQLSGNSNQNALQLINKTMETKNLINENYTQKRFYITKRGVDNSEMHLLHKDKSQLWVKEIEKASFF